MPSAVETFVKKSSSVRRVYLIDELRGLMVINMVIYHGIYNLVYMFGIDMPWYRGPVGFYWQQIVCGTFIVLAGMSCRFSSNNLKRGLLVFCCGLALSLITWIFMPQQLIAFGILHFMGSAMMIYSVCAPLLDRLTPAAGVGIFSVLFLLTRGIYYGRMGIPLLLEFSLPPELYSTPFLFMFGLPGPNFVSSDYFPLIPWLFLFLAGSFVGIWAKRRELPDHFYISHCPPLGAVGRKALIIYMLHQPILYGVMSLLFS